MKCARCGRAILLGRLGAARMWLPVKTGEVNACPDLDQGQGCAPDPDPLPDVVEATVRMEAINREVRVMIEDLNRRWPAIMIAGSVSYLIDVRGELGA